MNHILIIAGEASGDTLGAGFVREFLRLEPNSSFFGLGGDKMARAGVRLSYHIKDLAFLGFWEVIKNLRSIWKIEKDILDRTDKLHPQMAVLIDYPGFNLRLATKLKKQGIKVFYYVSPQIWAWGARRIKKIKENVDLMTTIFKFEKDIYEKAGMPVKWVGHPLLDEIKVPSDREEFFQRAGLERNGIHIGLFPGSRVQEVCRILPQMLLALKLISEKHPGVKGIIGKAPALDNFIYSEIIDRCGSNVAILEGSNYDIMAHAELNIVCSGTATLECAILGAPLIVVYKTSMLTYLIARHLIKIPDIGMVNVVAGRQIVPELIQSDCAAQKIADASLRYFENNRYLVGIKEQLSQIKSRLGEPGAARRAAEAAIEMLRG